MEKISFQIAFSVSVHPSVSIRRLHYVRPLALFYVLNGVCLPHPGFQIYKRGLLQRQKLGHLQNSKINKNYPNRKRLSAIDMDQYVNVNLVLGVLSFMVQFPSECSKDARW